MIQVYNMHVSVHLNKKCHVRVKEKQKQDFVFTFFFFLYVKFSFALATKHEHSRIKTAVDIWKPSVGWICHLIQASPCLVCCFGDKL